MPTCIYAYLIVSNGFIKKWYISFALDRVLKLKIFWNIVKLYTHYYFYIYSKYIDVFEYDALKYYNGHLWYKYASNQEKWCDCQ
jgi:hypothetical protein